MKTESDPLSDCPQPETKQEGNEWMNRDTDSTYDEGERQPMTDEGYDGDMEGDGGLMPPPSVIP